MKTNINLKSAEAILNSETVETAEVKNPTQMWKAVKAMIAKHGHSVRMIVKAEDDSVFMDITVKELKNGKFFMVNAIKETRRSQQPAARAKAAKPAVKTEEEIAAEKKAERKAKKAEYDRQRRARLKAAKEAAKTAAE